ncbi:MAG: hypothetical protein R3Y47_10895 [Lachnospiraceae bacterium]
MSAPLVAMVIVMILLIGFVTMVIYSLSFTVGLRIRSDVTKLLESYDGIIDEKSKKITELDKEIEQKKKFKPIFAKVEQKVTMVDSKLIIAQIPKAVRYRSAVIGEGYNRIRNNFYMSKGERASIISEITDQVMDAPNDKSETAQRIKEILSFEAIFQLSQLSGQQQYEILLEVLSEDKAFLEDFYNQKIGSNFSVIEFWDWLEECIVFDTRKVKVRCGEKEISEVERLKYSPYICEGIQIVAGNKIYDYSISEREFI